MKPRNWKLHWRRCYCLLWLHPGREIAVLAFKRRNMEWPYRLPKNKHGLSWITWKGNLSDRAKARIWSRTPRSKSI